MQFAAQVPARAAVEVDMKPIIKRTTNVRAEGIVEHAEILKLVLQQLGDDAPKNASITITVRVPGGGDWSSTDLDIEEHPVEFVAEWSVES